MLMDGHGRSPEGVMIRKGPWMAEEDEILMDYVNKYGPRHWSTIRSKGLLPRTGKSCRLRWVNKLKPDLKTGCKFSADEERMVIDLQEQFGNKWAKIATYLPGRTDNDVKNFWSTRQKRLARILQTSAPPKSQKNNGKLPVFREACALGDPALSSLPFQEESSNGQSSKPKYNMGNSDIIKMVALPDLINPNLLNLEANLPLPIEFRTVERKPCLYPSPQFPQPPLDLPPLPESQDLITCFSDTSFVDMYRNAPEPEDLQFPFELPFFELDVNQHCIKWQDSDLAIPGSFFHDFPADMFDHLEPLPVSQVCHGWRSFI